MYPSVNSVELVTHTKLLGVWIQDNFKVDMHVDYILSLCSQRIFLMKRLRDQGLSATYIHTVFQAIIVSRILYALPAWRCFLSKELSGRIDAFLKRCYRYGFASESEHVNVLFDRVCVDLFHKIRCSEHCLHDILPPVFSQCYDMRHRAHSFVLPQCNSNLYKISFIHYCLFEDV